jgi:hypothetical protein
MDDAPEDPTDLPVAIRPPDALVVEGIALAVASQVLLIKE